MGRVNVQHLRLPQAPKAPNRQIVYFLKRSPLLAARDSRNPPILVCVLCSPHVAARARQRASPRAALSQVPRIAREPRVRRPLPGAFCTWQPSAELVLQWLAGPGTGVPTFAAAPAKCLT